jgi:hypothetical protein
VKPSFDGKNQVRADFTIMNRLKDLIAKSALLVGSCGGLRFGSFVAVCIDEFEYLIFCAVHLSDF